jgi:hypothetical protein
MKCHSNSSGVKHRVHGLYKSFSASRDQSPRSISVVRPPARMQCMHGTGSSWRNSVVLDMAQRSPGSCGDSSEDLATDGVIAPLHPPSALANPLRQAYFPASTPRPYFQPAKTVAEATADQIQPRFVAP